MLLLCTKYYYLHDDTLSNDTTPVSASRGTRHIELGTISCTSSTLTTTNDRKTRIPSPTSASNPNPARQRVSSTISRCLCYPSTDIETDL